MRLQGDGEGSSGDQAVCHVSDGPCTFLGVTLLPSVRGGSGRWVAREDLLFCIHRERSSSGSCPPVPVSVAIRKVSVQHLELRGSVWGFCRGEG